MGRQHLNVLAACALLCGTHGLHFVQQPRVFGAFDHTALLQQHMTVMEVNSTDPNYPVWAEKAIVAFGMMKFRATRLHENMTHFTEELRSKRHKAQRGSAVSMLHVYKTAFNDQLSFEIRHWKMLKSFLSEKAFEMTPFLPEIFGDALGDALQLSLEGGISALNAFMNSVDAIRSLAEQGKRQNIPELLVACREQVKDYEEDLGAFCANFAGNATDLLIDRHPVLAEAISSKALAIVEPMGKAGRFLVDRVNQSISEINKVAFQNPGLI